MNQTTLQGKRSVDVLRDPELNRSTAFTEADKEALGLVGLIPDVTETEDVQLQRVLMQLGHKNSDSTAISTSSTFSIMTRRSFIEP
jgi:malate dehydrogenase (oxaloacetate-decarboxylating)(NADP+)